MKKITYNIEWELQSSHWWFQGRRRLLRFGLNIESENKINFPLINFFLTALFSIEPYILKYFSFPFGPPIYCVTEK